MMKPIACKALPSSYRILLAQKGFSLVELLVALFISLLLSMAVYQVFDIAQRTNRLQAAITQLQDSGRFALQTMAQDLRQTAFNGGCRNTAFHLEENSGLNGEFSPLMGWDSPSVTGFEDELASPVAMGNVVAFRGVAWTELSMSEEGVIVESANASQLNLSEPLDIRFQDNVLLVQAGNRCDVFLNTSSQADRFSKSRKASDLIRNKPPGGSDWGITAGSEVVSVSLLDNAVYYLGSDPVSNTPSLMYLDINQAAPTNQVVANHVAAMRLAYLEDGETSYQSAGDINDWQDVSALRISLLMQSEQNVRSAQEAEALAGEFGIGNFRGLTGTALENFTEIFSDNPQRLYQVFTTTIQLRNRL